MYAKFLRILWSFHQLMVIGRDTAHCYGFFAHLPDAGNSTITTCDNIYQGYTKQITANQHHSTQSRKFQAPESVMLRLSPAELDSILSLIDCGHSARHLAKTMGLSIPTVTRYWSQHRPDVPRSLGGCPSKLSPANVCHAVRLISLGKAENASQVARSLRTVTNQSITSQTVRNHLKSAGLKAVVKKKRPLLLKRHRSERLDFATAHGGFVDGVGGKFCGYMN